MNRIINSIKNSIVKKSILSIIVMLSLFTIIIGFIGYNRFADAMLDQYANGAFRAANMGASGVNADHMDEYVVSGGKTDEYLQTRAFLERLCNASGSTFVYVIQPDRTDYDHITFIFSTKNANKPYKLYEFGYVRETTNDDYRKKYKKLCEEGSDQELVIRDKGFIETDPHITAMVPLRDSDGETVAILCVQRQMDALSNARLDYLIQIIITLLCVTIIVVLSQGIYLLNTFLMPMKRITREASRFAAESTISDKKLTDSIRNTDEIGILAGSIDHMEEEIVNYMEDLTTITAEKERISTELNMAKEIQTSQLPSTFPAYPQRHEFDIFASTKPAKEVGGDFYDFFLIDEEHLCLLVADVSGKGIPAALFMMVSKALLKNRMLYGDSPAEALSNLNNQLQDGTETDMFVTVWLAVLNLKTGKGVAANAGHEHPILKRANGKYEQVIYRHSIVVGILPDSVYNEHEFTLNPGDTIVIYTDGVTEACNSSREMYGDTRLLNTLNQFTGKQPEKICDNLIDDIMTFTGEADQFDDITTMCLTYNGNETQD
ncbi:MAG: serine/threonine-protein phosphatase [Lachnospiraceae bacterium]|nr:serine/threonine-protein phosphatase [Lachnospiraceae bacterium]